MKILFVCGGGRIYGKEIVTLSLMEGFRKRGHEVMCVTSTWGGAFAERLDAIKVPYVRLPLGFISKTLRLDALWMTFAQLLKLPQLWLGYRRTVDEFKPDFVIYSTFHFLILLWPLLDAKKTIFHVHDFFKPAPFYRLAMNFLNLRIHAFVGVSKFIQDSLLQLGLPKGKIYFVLNGIDIDSEIINNGVGNLKPVTIGIVGQVGEWKGHNDFIEALKLLKDWNVAFQAVIFGEGDPKYVQGLQEKIESFQLTSQVHWRGYVKDKKEIYHQVDVVVILSHCQEAFSIVTNEAQHFGIPIIATRVGAIPEIIEDRETGFLVSPNFPPELAQKLKMLIQDSTLRKRIGQAGHHHAFKYLNQSRMAQEIEGLLLKMAHV